MTLSAASCAALRESYGPDHVLRALLPPARRSKTVRWKPNFPRRLARTLSPSPYAKTLRPPQREAKPADEAPSAAAAPASVAATSESSPVSGEVGIVRSGLQEASRDAPPGLGLRTFLRRSLAARMKHPL